MSEGVEREVVAPWHFPPQLKTVVDAIGTDLLIHFRL